MDDIEVAVILPAFNEELTIIDTLNEYFEQLPDATFVIVDNNSSDKTSALVRKWLENPAISNKSKVISEERQGKGLAVRRAFHQVSADVYVLIDADLTYPAQNVMSHIRSLLEQDLDMVIGNRRFEGAYSSVNDRKFHNFGNTILTRIVNFLFNSHLEDILSGYRIFSNRFVKTFPILGNGFQLEMELTLHSLDKRMRVMEFPIGYRKRPVESVSKLSTGKDGIIIGLSLMKIFSRYKALHFYGTAGTLLSLLGITIGFPAVADYFQTGQVLRLPSAVLAAALETLACLFFVIGIILRNAHENSKAEFEVELLRHVEKRDKSAE
jgi:glycosyltransferase involved in cell wall biosynthesis